MDVSIDLLEGDLDERIRRLDLEANVAELHRHGYTVVRDAAPIELFDRIRERVVEMVETQRKEGMAPVFADIAWMLLGRGRIFEEALCNPRLVALNELMLGRGFQIYTYGGSVKRQKGPEQAGEGLHNDYTAIRPPYPTHCQVLTSLWCCDDWTEEGGATRVVPGSFRWRRSPTAAELGTKTVPVECPRGSIIVWDGATWHTGGVRQLPGIRVALHTPHSRMAVRPIERYDRLPDEIVERNPPVLGRMVGREDFFGKTTAEHGPDPVGLARVKSWIET